MIIEQYEKNNNKIELVQLTNGIYVQGGRFKITWSIHYSLNEMESARNFYESKTINLR